MTVLLSNVVIATGADVKVNTGKYVFAVWGTSIGQATVTLQRKMPNDAYLAISAAATMTVFGNAVVELPGGLYRATVTDGGTDPVGVFAALDRL